MVGECVGQRVCVEQRCEWQGVCMGGGVHGRGHAWWTCIAGGHAWGIHGRGHTWKGAYMEEGVCVVGDMHGRGVCMAGRFAFRRDGH